MDTPSISHITNEDYKYVYEPAEDSFLMLDAMELDLEELKLKKPLIVLEIGSGSGIIITAIAQQLKSSKCFAIDINPVACTVTKKTAAYNKANVEVLNMDLMTAFQPNSIDLLIFNPPYVPDQLNIETTENGHLNRLITKSWIGGTDGCFVTNRILDKLHYYLRDNGLFYLLLLKENNPNMIADKLISLGFCVSHHINRKIRGEHLFVLKIIKPTVTI